MESLSLDASAKSEMSVSRSSSLIANLSHFDDLEDDTHDLFVHVDDPEKHTGTMESYVTFRISTKVNILLIFTIFHVLKYICMTHRYM